MRDSLNNYIPKSALIVRATEVSEFRNCRRKWYLSSHNGMNLEPLVTDTKLAEGICWHAGLESYYTCGDFSAGYEKAFAEELEKLRNTIGDGIYDDEIQAQLKKQKERDYAVFEHYKEKAATELWPCDNDFKIVGTEIRIVVPLKNEKGNRTTAWIAVRFDGIARIDGAYYILEHKYQSASSNVDNPSNLTLDLQTRIQIWALQQYLNYHNRTNPRVVGVLYNLTRKQIPGPKVKNPICGRHLVTVSSKEMDIFVKDLRKDIKDIRATIRKPEERTYNPQMYGVCSWGCAFRSICEAMNKGEDVDLLIDTLFKKRDKDIWQMLSEEMK